MTKTVLSITAIVLLGLGGFALLSSGGMIRADGPDAAETIAAPSTEEQTQVFAIKNMSCPACPFTVKKAMARVEGVREVTVDFDAKTATAVFDPAIAKAEDVAAASTDIGYPATLIESE